jgi:Rrf2 family protein
MKLSTTAGHAVRALVFLARRPPGRPVPSHTIARAHGLPELFLLKVLRPLVAVGVLLSVKGVHGGYRLARPAQRISLLDVVEAIDGPVRGEVPRWAAGAEGARLDAGLQEVCDATAEVVRARLRKVSIAGLVGDRKG